MKGQNIPKQGETGSTIRKSFVSSDGCSFIGIDCSNFQIRILANYLAEYGETEDAQAFAKEFNTKEKADPHQVTADLLGVDRTTGKTLNFSVIFGLGAMNLAKRLHIDEAEGRKLFRKMKDFFPSLPALKEKIWNACISSGGVVHDLYGRRGYYPSITSQDKQEVARSQRQVFNFVIQASEATVMKMLTMEVIVAGQPYGAKLVLSVHDELLVECPDAYTEVMKQEMERIFSKPYLPLVRMKGDARVGKNWESAH